MHPRTLFDKVWSSHVIAELPGGVSLLAIDRHLLHDLEGGASLRRIRDRGLEVHNPELTFSVPDHAVATAPDRRADSTPNSSRLLREMKEGSEASGITYFDLGTEGQGFAPMQLRLATRRAEMAANAIGMAQRALDMMIDYAPQRTTFGKPLSERQTIQNWVSDAAIKLHAARLMTYDCAWKLDQGRDTRTEVTMIKSFALETAWEVLDHAMQCFGAMGMTREMPLQQMAARIRLMRIYDGPTEIHNWVVARNLLGTRA